MNKNWNNSIVNIPGTIKVDSEGKIAFTANQFGKFTATLKVADDTPWTRLARKTTFVFVDGLRQTDVDAFKALEAAGEITGSTELVFTGHLVRTPGKPGMNDILNLKTLGIRPKAEGEKIVYSIDEALTKDEWQFIRKERFGGTTTPTAAPVAPAVPVAPF